MLINLLVLCIFIAILYWIATVVAPLLPSQLQRLPVIIVAVIALLMLLNTIGLTGQPLIHVR